MNQHSTAPHLVWINTEALSKTMDAVTWLETARALRELGWKVTLVTSDPPDVKNIAGVEITGLSKSSVYFFGLLLFHWRLMFDLWRRNEQVDVILFHQMSTLALLPFIMIRRLLGTKHPIFVMDTRTVVMSQVNGGSYKVHLRALFFKAVYRIAPWLVDGQTVITKRMAQKLQIHDENIWGIWPSGVEPGRFSQAAHARTWPAEESPISIIYIGSLHTERNLLGFCSAIEAANRDHLKFRFMIVGDGTQRPALEEFAQQTDGRIVCLPTVPHHQIPQILAQAHVGVLPFPDEEKFRVSSPIKLFEYMAAGMPVLATRIDCHTDVVGDGSYVFWADGSNVADLEQGLLLVWQNRRSLKEMGQSGSKAVADWSWHASAKKLDAALKKGLGDTTTTAAVQW